MKSFYYCVVGSRSPYFEVVIIPPGARNFIIRQQLGKNILGNFSSISYFFLIDKKNI